MFHVRRVPPALTHSDVLVVLGVALAAATLLAPVLAASPGLQAGIMGCLAHCRAMGVASLAFAQDHAGTLPEDNSARGTNPRDLRNETPASAEAFEKSWFARLSGYRAEDAAQWDCPLVGHTLKRDGRTVLDHRKTEHWPSDYCLAFLGVGMSIDATAEPARVVLIGEPNMFRTPVGALQDIFARPNWVRADHEQTIAGSVSFTFVDGQTVRVPVAEAEDATLGEYPQILFRPGLNIDGEREFAWSR